MQSTVTWRGKMAFDGRDEEGHLISLDAPEKVGGEGNGQRPKQLILEALAGCTAMDVISILRKMKCLPASFRVEVSADETDEHPKVFTAFHLRYIVSGEVPEQKLQRAIELSQDQYCGVSAMLRKAANISHEYCYEEESNDQ
jgi:putative redox protein